MSNRIGVHAWAHARSCVLTVLISLLATSHATAATDGGAIEEIVVTGSYIKGSPEDAPSPIQVMDRDFIVESGVSDIAELVRNLEIASGSDTAAINENRFNGNSGAGLANVNLRGLGPTATLTLLDGKRLPFAGQKLADGDRFVDINSIPITMIERVEVLKDGGSAIYGSDAIAGVVNFITRRDFEGFELTGKFQTTDQGSQDDQTLGAIFGWASDDQATHFVVGGEYFDRTHLRSNERYDLTRDVYEKQNGNIVNRFSFFGPDAGCDAVGLGFFTDNGRGSDPNACNRVGADTEIFFPAQERTALMATFDHAFNDSFQVYAQASYNDSRSGEKDPVHVGPIEPKYALPGFFGTGGATGGLFPFAFNDPSLDFNGGTIPTAPFFGALELTDYQVRVPGIDAVREYDAHNEQESTRFQLGIKGDFELGDKPWSYDISYTRGDSEFSTNFLGLDSDRLELAAYGLGGPDCVPNGDLANPTARFLLAGLDGTFDSTSGVPGAVGPLEGTMEALMGTVEGQPFINPDNVVVAMTSTNNGDNSQGCYFFNPFLTRAIPGNENPEELLRWLEVEMEDAQKSETFLTVIDFVVAGDLFELPAGPLSMAFGAQYREEGRETFVHPQTIGAVNSFGQQSGNESVAGLSENRNYDEERDIWAVFAEFKVPLHEDIEMQLAARYEDYGSGIGSTFDPKVGVRWQAADSLVFRGSVSSSFRGPALAQIAEGTGFSLEFGVADVLGEGNNIAGQNCVRTGRCAIPASTDAPTIIIVKKGERSPDLEPETAWTYNFGAIWSPVSGPLEGLTVGIDYYIINFEDKITDVPTQAFLTEELGLFQSALSAGDFVISVPGQPDFGAACDPNDAQFDPGVANPRSEVCQVNPTAYAITPSNSSFAGGSISRRVDVSRDLQIIGSGAINTGKVETDGIDFNLTYVWDMDIGTFVFDGRFNWINSFDVKDFPVGQPDFQAAGFTNNDPERRLSRSMPDLKGNFGLSWMSGQHSARGNTRFVGAYEDNGSANNIIGDGKLDSYFAFDLNYTYAAEIGNSQLVFSVGAIDLFDASLPKLKNVYGTDLQTFDPRGRRFYTSLTYRM
ncbi:MAG: TonB-dependent receptor [Gammaproteobacteria bacterium]|nr:TonB-dependent receptor [Gammaproteobacteria bacterium]